MGKWTEPTTASPQCLAFDRWRRRRCYLLCRGRRCYALGRGTCRYLGRHLLHRGAPQRSRRTTRRLCLCRGRSDTPTEVVGDRSAADTSPLQTTNKTKQKKLPVTTPVDYQANKITKKQNNGWVVCWLPLTFTDATKQNDGDETWRLWRIW